MPLAIGGGTGQQGRWSAGGSGVEGRGLTWAFGWTGSTSGLGTKTTGDQSPRESVGRTESGVWGKREPKKRAAREEGGKLEEVSGERVRSQGLERAHGICNQVLISTLLHSYICSSRVEKNEGGGS